MSLLAVQPRDGWALQDPRLLIPAVADTVASHTLLYKDLVDSIGGQYNASEKLQIEQFIGDRLESTLGIGVAGSRSPPLVNSRGEVVELPLSGSDHVIDHQGAGGAQSLFAIGAPNWIGKNRRMICVIAENEQGELVSA